MKLKNIYIHIPFCKKKCSFCDFSIYAVGNNSFKDPQLKKYFDEVLSDEYVDKLVNEIKIFGDNFGSKENLLKSIYFGGGTPTLLHPSKIEKILNTVSKYFSFNSQETEISIESDPNTFDKEKLNYLTDNIGFNRITMGVQSLDPKVFKHLNRSHNIEDTFKSIDLIKQSKFENNFGLDLIQGLPDQTVESAINDIKTLNNLNIPHLSVYMLSLENNSSLFRKYEKEYISAKKQNDIADMFCLTHDFLSKNYYEQYEISNFCKNSKYSVHNKCYWDGFSEFYGFGSSASSYFLNKRFKKPKSIKKYKEFVDKNFR
jgi:oxygen-independent coproporphyrinogen III oxidase